jgi:ribosome-binding factor A
VEIPEDLLTAKVFVSVLGTEGQQTRTIRALQHAAGHLQELLRDRVCLRHTPVLSFELDTQFKKTLQTLDMIERAMEEIRQKELAREAEAQAEPQAQAAPAAGDSPAPDSPARPAGSP